MKLNFPFPFEYSIWHASAWWIVGSRVDGRLGAESKTRKWHCHGYRDPKKICKLKNPIHTGEGTDHR